MKITIGLEQFLQSLETRSPLLLSPLFATHARARPRPMVGLLWFPRVAPQHLQRLHPPRLCTLLPRLLTQSLYHHLSPFRSLTLQREDKGTLEVLCCRVDAPLFQSCGLHAPSSRRRARSSSRRRHPTSRSCYSRKHCYALSILLKLLCPILMGCGLGGHGSGGRKGVLGEKAEQGVAATARAAQLKQPSILHFNPD